MTPELKSMERKRFDLNTASRHSTKESAGQPDDGNCRFNA